MGYRNKTYVIFDGDNDIHNYRLMQAWKKNKNIEFDFHDAHDLNVITNLSSENNTKRKLRERFSSAKQVIVLVGSSTKNLYKFVRWEIDVALNLGIPIVVANLNQVREFDKTTCPAILRDRGALFVSFQPTIIKFALNHFCEGYEQKARDGQNWKYGDEVYRKLGL